MFCLMLTVNEARSDWRPLLFEKLAMSPTPTKTLAEVAVFVNQHIWSELNPSKPVYFKPQQTPLIYDPMSAISFGFASCTGLSILYVDALRSVGVPARLVGTPAWHGKFADGNHNWVASWKLFFLREYTVATKYIIFYRIFFQPQPWATGVCGWLRLVVFYSKYDFLLNQSTKRLGVPVYHHPSAIQHSYPPRLRFGLVKVEVFKMSHGPSWSLLLQDLGNSY